MTRIVMLRSGLVLLAVAGLAVDAYVHFDLASTYDPIASTTLSQGDLFRAEGVVAIIAAVAFIARPRRYTAAFAALVGLGGAIAVITYRYADIPDFGPIPRMYEPIWFSEKTLSLIAEVTAFAAASVCFALLSRRAAQSPSTGDVAEVAESRDGARSGHSS